MVVGLFNKSIRSSSDFNKYYKERRKHFEECLALADELELQGKYVKAGIMRVAANNDYSDWKAVPKPPLGKIRVLASRVSFA